MKANNVVWERDGIDSGWFTAAGIGSVRNGYRSGGWWFLPDWLPDTTDHDVGPFKTKAAAIEHAEALALTLPKNRRATS